MATSRKDYIAIAKILEAERRIISHPDNAQAQEILSAEAENSRIAYRLADYFTGDNSLFNKDRFLKACGVIND